MSLSLDAAVDSIVAAMKKLQAAFPALCNDGNASGCLTTCMLLYQQTSLPDRQAGILQKANEAIRAAQRLRSECRPDVPPTDAASRVREIVELLTKLDINGLVEVRSVLREMLEHPMAIVPPEQFVSKKPRSGLLPLADDIRGVTCPPVTAEMTDRLIKSQLAACDADVLAAISSGTVTDGPVADSPADPRLTAAMLTLEQVRAATGESP